MEVLFSEFNKYADNVSSFEGVDLVSLNRYLASQKDNKSEVEPMNSDPKLDIEFTGQPLTEEDKEKLL